MKEYGGCHIKFGSLFALYLAIWKEVKSMHLIQTELTPKERMSLYHQGKEVDRVPVTMSLGETIPLLYGIPMSKYYWSADLMVEVESRMAEDFCLDNMGVGLGLRTLVEALGVKMCYTDNRLSYVQEAAITDYAQLDSKELVNIHKDGRIPIILDSFKRLMDVYGETRNISSGLAGPVTMAASMIGTEKFLKDTVKNTEGIHKLMRFCTDNVIQCAKDFNQELGITMSLSEPLCSKDILSLKQFREFGIPYLKEIVEAFKTFQSAPSLHICGKTKDRWEELVGLGVSSFWMDNCENMREFKEHYGEILGVSGNVAPVQILKDGTLEQIEQEVKKCMIDAADAKKGFILSPGCTVPVYTDKNHIIAMVNAAAIYGRGAKKGSYPKGIEAYLDS